MRGAWRALGRMGRRRDMGRVPRRLWRMGIPMAPPRSGPAGGVGLVGGRVRFPGRVPDVRSVQDVGVDGGGDVGARHGGRRGAATLRRGRWGPQGRPPSRGRTGDENRLFSGDPDFPFLGHHMGTYFF